MRILTPIAFCVAATLSTAAEVPAGQSSAASSPEAAGTITGRVTIGAQGTPGVAIALQPAPEGVISPLPQPVARATTDREGRFQLTRVAAGRYYLIPLAPAYVGPSENRMGLPGKLVTLRQGENLEGIELALTPGGVITGRVTTAGGWPVIDREIDVFLTGVAGVIRDNSTKFKTDDRGVYRIYGLSPGRYLVSVKGDDRSRPPIPTFPPGVTDQSQAKPIEIVAGGEVENVDIKLAPITRTYEVSGRVVEEATGRPIPKIRVDWSTLKIAGQSGGYHWGGPSANDQGEFHLTGLLPGRYAVFVPISSGSEYYSDEVAFEVSDQDVAGLEIKAHRAASLGGTIVIEGTRDPAILADLSHLHITVFKLEGGMGSGVQAGADGRFRVSGLPPDKFRIQLNSRIQRQRFSLLRIERDGVQQPNRIELAAGEQVTGLRMVVAYGAGVVHGQVQVVGGTLPEGARLSVSARRTDVPGQPSSAQGVEVDARGRFLLEGLATGEHEIVLTTLVRSPSGGPRLSPLRPPVKQNISVTSGAEPQVTIVLDLNASNVKEQK